MVAQSMFPNYVHVAMLSGITKGAELALKAYDPVETTYDELVATCVQPALIKPLETAASVVGGSRWHHIDYEMTFHDRRFTMPIGTCPGIIWPDNPQPGWDVPEGTNLAMRCRDWADYQEEQAVRWTQAKLLVSLVGKLCTTARQLRYIWPDFDLILSIPGAKDANARAWLNREWSKPFTAPHVMPRRVECLDEALEDARRLIMAATMLDPELRRREAPAMSVRTYVHKWKTFHPPWADETEEMIGWREQDTLVG